LVGVLEFLNLNLGGCLGTSFWNLIRFGRFG
jgi:hypothetical protein